MVAALAQAVKQSQRGRAATRRLRMQNESPPHFDLTDALNDAVSLFRELRLSYALIGGLAAMVHGRSRYTEDVDFVAEAGHEERLAASPEIMKKHGFDPSCTWKLYHRSGIDIDLWKDPHVGDIVERAVRRKLGDRFVKVAEPHDLIAMKLRADRPQDDYDISEIIKAQTIDPQTIKARVTSSEFGRFGKIVERSARG